MSLGIILLAAGSSSRMGQSKQLLDFNGESLLLRAAKTALQSGVGPVTVVLGAREVDHKKIIQHLDVNLVSNPRWEFGMGSSLKAGLSHWVSIAPQSEGVLVILCDQPLLTAGYLKRLADSFYQSGKPIAASRYGDSSGVPAVFSHSLFGEILRLADDQGAKKIIALLPEQTHYLDFKEGAIDIDTQEDYDRFVRQFRP